ncbi:AAA family ATPase [Saccharopolyspora hattusasensis]|uniref:AAA family ATPase n=1 Tax=Saccharopolyspora hattusasensis TaxID=1128679 RepID=UPI003D96A38F
MTDPSSSAPTAYLLVGLPGSGKSTYARRLEDQGVIRLSVDEVLAQRHGRYGIDYPHPRHGELQAPILAELTDRMVTLLREGRSVAFDHGLWTRANRDAYKKLVHDAGASWTLLYFAAPKDVLLARLSQRNTEADDNAEVLNISPGALDDFYSRFEEPTADEAAEIVPQI